MPGPYLELFARAPRAGWHAWGREVATGPADRRWASNAFPPTDIHRGLLLGKGGLSGNVLRIKPPIQPKLLAQCATGCSECIIVTVLEQLQAAHLAVPAHEAPAEPALCERRKREIGTEQAGRPITCLRAGNRCGLRRSI